MPSTMLTDLAHVALHKSTIAPAAVIASPTGVAVDCQLMDGPIHAFLNIGVVSGTNPTMDIKLQESDASGGTYTDIPGAVFSQKIAAGVDVISTNQRTLRWVRALGTLGGTSTPTFNMAVAIVGQKKIVGTGTGYIA